MNAFDIRALQDHADNEAALSQTLMDIIMSEAAREVAQHSRSRASRKGWRSRKKNEHDRIDATTEQLKAERGMAA